MPICVKQGCKRQATRGGNACAAHDPKSAACAKQGCKGKAIGGSIFCAAHDPNTPHGGGAPRGNINTWLGMGIASLYTEEERDALASSFGPDLGGEIEALRVLLVRSFAEDNRERVIATVNALVKAASVQHRLQGSQASDLLTAIDRVLAELGVGEGGDSLVRSAFAFGW